MKAITAEVIEARKENSRALIVPQEGCSQPGCSVSIALAIGTPASRT
jgi:hypothetical protein